MLGSRVGDLLGYLGQLALSVVCLILLSSRTVDAQGSVWTTCSPGGQSRASASHLVHYRLEEVRVVHPRGGDARWSPDGHQFLYTVCDAQGCTLWLADADGSNPRALTRGQLASWSSDGKRIAYQVGNLAIYDLAARRGIGLPVGASGRPYWFDQDKQLFFLGRDSSGFSGFRGVAGILDLDTLVSQGVGIQISPEAAWKAREWVERIESHEGQNPRKEVVFGTFQDVFNQESLSDSRLIQDEWSAVQARMAMHGLEWNIRRTLNGNFPGLWARARNGCSFQQIMTRQVANVRRSPGGERLLWEEQGVGLVAARIRPDATHDQYLSAGIGRTSGLLAGDLVGIFEGVVNPLNNKLVGHGRVRGFGLVVGVQAENATIRIIGALEPGVGKIGTGDVISLPWGEAWAAVQEAGEPKWDEEGLPRAVIPIWEQLPFIDMGVNGSVSQEVLTYLFKTRADSGRTRYLLQELDNSTTLLRAEAMEAVGRLRESAAVPRLRKELTSHDYQAAPRVVWALGEIGDRASIPVLEDFIKAAARYDNTAIQVLAAKLAIEKLRIKGAVQGGEGGSAATKEENVAIARPGPVPTAALPPGSTGGAGQIIRVQFANESSGPVRLQITGNNQIEVGGRRWATIQPGKSDEIPVMIGQQKLRVEKVRTAGPVLLWAGFRREKTVEIAPNKSVQIRDDDFK